MSKTMALTGAREVQGFYENDGLSMSDLLEQEYSASARNFIKGLI
jgi:hypothetical protein